jgi:hypothetical protein
MQHQQHQSQRSTQSRDESLLPLDTNKIGVKYDEEREVL